MSEFQVGQVLTWKNIDGVEREGTLLKQDPMNGFDLVQPAGTSLDLHQLLVARSELRPALPRAGDLVRAASVLSYFNHGNISVGEEFVLGATKPYEPQIHSAECAGHVAAFREGGGSGAWCKLILLRRAGTPAAEEVRCYGTRPAFLPETLPDGTFCDWAGTEYKIFGAKLDGVIYQAERYEHPGDSTRGGGFPADKIRWPEVPIQPSPAAEVAKGWVPGRGERIRGKHAHTKASFSGSFLQFNSAGYAQVDADDNSGIRDLLRESIRPISPPPVGSAKPKPRCGGVSPTNDHCDQPYGHSGACDPKPGSSKDPYARGRELDAMAAAAGSPYITLPPEVREFVAWQAKQRRHLEQAKSELDRPVSSHPREWPERAFDDADELYPTY